MLKQTKEHIRAVTESEIEGYDIEKLQARLKKFTGLVADCDCIIKDCTENLMTAAKMEDITESKDLKNRINDAAANREIFEIKVSVIALRLKQLKHEAAMKLCGKSPALPNGMDMLTFSIIVDHLHEKTESILIGENKTIEEKKWAKMVKEVIKCNAGLKNR